MSVLLLLMSARFSSAQLSHVVVNEVEANPYGTDENNEWLELFNPTSSAVDISGWTITTTHGTTCSYTIPSGNTIDSMSWWVVTFGGQCLDNDDESVILSDGSGIVVDQTPAKTDSNDARSWQRVPDAGDNWVKKSATKGYTNVQILTLSPNVGFPGTTVTATGSGWGPETFVDLTVTSPPSGDLWDPPATLVCGVSGGNIASGCIFVVKLGATPGPYIVTVTGETTPPGPPAGPFYRVTATAGFTVPPPTTITSLPEGSGFVKVDDLAITTPQIFNWWDGETHNLEALSPVSGGLGIQYVWVSWSDGGEQTHTYTTSAAYRTVTANYRTQYQLTIQVSPDGGGSTDPPVGTSWHDSDTSVGVTATAASGYVLDHWDLDGSNVGEDQPYYVAMNAPHTLTAIFQVPPTVQVTIDSSPQGLGFVKVDDTAVTTPQTFAWVSGSTHTLEASSPVSGAAGIQYVFTDWSDGEAQTHTYTMPADNTLLTANYRTQFYITIISPRGQPTSSGWVDESQDYATSVTSPDGSYECHGYRVDGGVLQPGTSYTFTNVQAPHTIKYMWSLNTVTTTITSNPAGSGFVTVDDVYYITPHSFNWVVGSLHKLEALSPVGGQGVQYVWLSWSDGGAQTHTYTTPSSAETVTASYNQATIFAGGGYRKFVIVTLELSDVEVDVSSGPQKVIVRAHAVTSDGGAAHFNYRWAVNGGELNVQQDSFIDTDTVEWTLTGHGSYTVSCTARAGGYSDGHAYASVAAAPEFQYTSLIMMFSAVLALLVLKRKFHESTRDCRSPRRHAFYCMKMTTLGNLNATSAIPWSNH